MKNDKSPFLSQKFMKTPLANESKGNNKNDKLTSEKSNSVNDSFDQMEGFRLFSYFTANIIKEDVIFTR